MQNDADLPVQNVSQAQKTKIQINKSSKEKASNPKANDINNQIDTILNDKRMEIISSSQHQNFIEQSSRLVKEEGKSDVSADAIKDPTNLINMDPKIKLPTFTKIDPKSSYDSLDLSNI